MSSIYGGIHFSKQLILTILSNLLNNLMRQISLLLPGEEMMHREAEVYLSSHNKTVVDQRSSLDGAGTFHPGAFPPAIWNPKCPVYFIFPHLCWKCTIFLDWGSQLGKFLKILFSDYSCKDILSLPGRIRHPFLVLLQHTACALLTALTFYCYNFFVSLRKL